MPPILDHLAKFQAKQTQQQLARMASAIVPNTVKKYSVSFAAGVGTRMEDRFLVKSKLFSNPEGIHSLYGVFDAHNSASASQYCVDNLTNNIDEQAFRKNAQQAIADAFVKTDHNFCSQVKSISSSIDEPTAFSNTIASMGGTTACLMFVRQNMFTIFNTGDSRALLINKDGTFEQISEDHKPDRADERKRIFSAGGTVSHFSGVWRVNGSLAMTRAIGDKQLKSIIIPNPEVYTRIILDSMAFVILGTDGLFDVLNNQKIASIIQENQLKTAAQVSERLLKEVEMEGFVDNTTILTVEL